MSTKQQFFDTYRDMVVARFEWAKDPERLTKFMGAVRTTLNEPKRIPWQWESDTSKEAWRSIGCKGRLTLKGLKALEGEVA